MANFNKVILAGNLTRDPELRHTPQGTAVCDLSIAVNRTYTNKQTNQKVEEVSFIDCVAWARTAEVISEHMRKGRPILVEGNLKQERWEDATTGQKRSKLKVIVESFQFLGSKDQGAGGAPGRQEQAAASGAEEDVAF